MQFIYALQSHNFVCLEWVIVYCYNFRCLLELIPQQNRTSDPNDKLIVDGADGVGGEKIENLKKMLSSLCIEVRNSGGGVLNEGVGADYVQKEKVVPRSFGSTDVGKR